MTQSEVLLYNIKRVPKHIYEKYPYQMKWRIISHWRWCGKCEVAYLSNGEYQCFDNPCCVIRREKQKQLELQQIEDGTWDCYYDHHAEYLANQRWEEAWEKKEWQERFRRDL